MTVFCYANNMKKYKAVIFDLDGVLIETEEIHMRAMAKSFADNGYILEDHDFKKIIGRHHSEYVAELINDHGWDHQRVSAIINTFRGYYHSLWDNEVQLRSGSQEVLDFLTSKNIICALATNSSLLTVNKFIAKFNLQNVFAYITTSDEITKKKPDPEIYLIAKNKLNIIDKFILTVEDSSVGLAAAQAANLHVAVISTQVTHNQDFTLAEYHFNKLLDIISLFNTDESL